MRPAPLIAFRADPRRIARARETRNSRVVYAPQKVIKFLINCGNKNLQYLLVPARLEAALAVLDTDRDGHIDMVEWCASEFYNLGRLRRGRRGDGVLVA